MSLQVVGGNLQKTDEEAIAAAAEHVKVAVSKSQKLDEYSIKLSEVSACMLSTCLHWLIFASLNR